MSLYAPMNDGRVTCPECDGTGAHQRILLRACEGCGGERRVLRGRIVDCAGCGSDALASVGLCRYCQRQPGAMEAAS